MPQAQQGRHPGYGVVYPDPANGIKVVRTFTEGAHRSYNSDGSVTWSTPPPVIHELYGGGFVYQSGAMVDDRKHLECITNVDMREKALKWFDTNQGLSEEATKDVPPLDLENQKRPEPVYAVSSDFIKEGNPVPEVVQLVKQEQKPDATAEILSALKDISTTLKAHGEEIERLKTAKPEPRRRGTMDPETKMKRRETMKKYWAERKANEQRIAESSEKV